MSSVVGMSHVDCVHDVSNVVGMDSVDCVLPLLFPMMKMRFPIHMDQ